MANARLELNNGQTLFLQLVGRWREDAVPGCLEVSTRDDFQSLTNVDNQSTRAVWRVMPLLILAPDLQTRNGDREE